MSSGLQKPDSGFYLTQLANLSTILREWHALHSIDRVLFKQILLSGTPPSAQLENLRAPHVSLWSVAWSASSCNPAISYSSEWSLDVPETLFGAARLLRQLRGKSVKGIRQPGLDETKFFLASRIAAVDKLILANQNAHECFLSGLQLIKVLG